MKYLKIEIRNITQKKNIYKFLRENNFSEHFISALRNNLDNILINGKPTNVRGTLKNGDILEISKNPYKATEIELMYRARFWEESHFSGDALNAVLETVKRERLTEKMIRDIVCRYARFGKGTYDRLLPHLKGILST